MKNDDVKENLAFDDEGPDGLKGESAVEQMEQKEAVEEA